MSSKLSSIDQSGSSCAASSVLTAPETLHKKGHAVVASDRPGGPCQLYYELHGNPKAENKVLLVMG